MALAKHDPLNMVYVEHVRLRGECETALAKLEEDIANIVRVHKQWRAHTLEVRERMRAVAPSAKNASAQPLRTQFKHATMRKQYATLRPHGKELRASLDQVVALRAQIERLALANDGVHRFIRASPQ